MKESREWKVRELAQIAIGGPHSSRMFIGGTLRGERDGEMLRRFGDWRSFPMENLKDLRGGVIHHVGRRGAVEPGLAPARYPAQRSRRESTGRRG